MLTSYDAFRAARQEINSGVFGMEVKGGCDRQRVSLIKMTDSNGVKMAVIENKRYAGHGNFSWNDK